VTYGGKLVWMMTKCWVTVVAMRVSSYAKGYCCSCGLSTLHISNLRASRHNLLSYPQNGDNRYDLLEAMEESRRSGAMNRSLNLTFLVLIPKVNKPISFGDFRPIALCNLIYKIIAKLIATRIKPLLSQSLSRE
jgi:hypothetical protein